MKNMEPAGDDMGANPPDACDGSDGTLSDSERTISDFLVTPNTGYYDQQEVDSVRAVVPPVGEEDSSFDSERTHTATFGHVPSDGRDDAMEADSGYRRQGGEDLSSHVEVISPMTPIPQVEHQKENLPLPEVQVAPTYHSGGKQKAPLRTDQGKSVDHDQQDVVRLKGKSGILRILPKKNKMVRDTGDGNILSRNTIVDRETSDGKLLPMNTTVDGKTGDGRSLPTKRGLLKLLSKNNKDEKHVVHIPSDGHGTYVEAESGHGKAGDHVLSTCAEVTDLNIAPLRRVNDRKEYLPLPQWLTDIISVDDRDRWQHFQIARTDYSGRKDKYFTHRDYRHTFRSNVEVIQFVRTGEFIRKGLLRKRSADPSGQDCDPSHSTRTLPQTASNPIYKPQGSDWSARGGMDPNSSELPDGFL